MSEVANYLTGWILGAGFGFAVAFNIYVKRGKK